jgi:hypothetical protein
MITLLNRLPKTIGKLCDDPTGYTYLGLVGRWQCAIDGAVSKDDRILKYSHVTLLK